MDALLLLNYNIMAKETCSSAYWKLWPDDPLNFSLESKYIWMTILPTIYFRSCVTSILNLVNKAKLSLDLPELFTRISNGVLASEVQNKDQKPTFRGKQVCTNQHFIGWLDRLLLYQTVVLSLFKFIQAFQRTHILA